MGENIVTIPADKIESFIETLKKRDLMIDKLFYLLQQYADIIIIGGAVRDIVYNNRMPRDIDIILVMKNNYCLDAIFSEQGIDYCRNRFNGYKLLINEIEFDIWKIEDHWAFKNKMYETSIENIKNTTFLNYDSILYNMSNKQIESKGFEKCERNKVLDIIEEESKMTYNPTPYTNMARILNICSQNGYTPSERVCKYVIEYRKQVSSYEKFCERIYEAYIKHYKQNISKQQEKKMRAIMNEIFHSNI